MLATDAQFRPDSQARRGPAMTASPPLIKVKPARRTPMMRASKRERTGRACDA